MYVFLLKLGLFWISTLITPQKWNFKVEDGFVNFLLEKKFEFRIELDVTSYTK